MSSAETPAPPNGPDTEAGWLASLMRPILAFRLRYLPLVMVYFAYGALGIIDVTRDMWVKERLTLSPAELAGIETDARSRSAAVPLPVKFTVIPLDILRRFLFHSESPLLGINLLAELHDAPRALELALNLRGGALAGGAHHRLDPACLALQ